MEKDSTNSILVGDYIGENSFAETLRIIFFDEINAVREIKYVHHNLFYIVYINNLSVGQFEKINQGLKPFEPYVGYFDLSYASFAKTCISTMLVRLIVKNRNKIIVGSEDSQDVNDLGYPFEKCGYILKGVETIYYDLFLSYKIEREIVNGFESDTHFSINAVSRDVLDLADFSLIIKEAKLRYLVENKTASLERAGLGDITVDQLEGLIKSKISQNYIYNLSFDSEHDTIKFNILIETRRTDSNGPMKLTVALEYLPSQKVLRLITMY